MIDKIMPWILAGIVWLIALMFIAKFVYFAIKCKKTVDNTPRLPDINEPPKKMNNRIEMEEASQIKKKGGSDA